MQTFLTGSFLTGSFPTRVRDGNKLQPRVAEQQPHAVVRSKRSASTS